MANNDLHKKKKKNKKSPLKNKKLLEKGLSFKFFFFFKFLFGLIFNFVVEDIYHSLISWEWFSVSLFAYVTTFWVVGSG